MVRANLKGVFATYKIAKNGTRKAYWYHRKTGRRLHGEPGSAEFVADFVDASRPSTILVAGTFNQLIRDYTLSPEFEIKLATSTKAEYRRMLTKAEGKFGDMPFATLDDWRVRQEFLDWRNEVAKESGLREADHRLSTISAMLSWAVKRGKLSANHLKGFDRLYQSDRSDIIWGQEHVNGFMKVAPVELQRALILALHTGQREGDLLRLPWSAYDGSVITLRQSKAKRGKKLGRLITIPVTGALRRMLDGMERKSPLILTTKSGRSFKKRYFAHAWDTAMKNAGLQTVVLRDVADPVHLHFHDLRGTAITLLSEAECTPQQIATITGHTLTSVNRILEKYLKRTIGLAEAAIDKFENSSRTKFANQLQTGAPEEKTVNEK